MLLFITKCFLCLRYNFGLCQRPGWSILHSMLMGIQVVWAPRPQLKVVTMWFEFLSLLSRDLCQMYLIRSFFVIWSKWPKTKKSAILFVHFFLNSSKPVLIEKFFLYWPMRNNEWINRRADFFIFGRFDQITKNRKWIDETL